MGGNLAPSYTTPPAGLTAWARPDSSAPAAAHIPHRVEMRLLEQHGDWAHIECSNGWQAWVDGRALVPVAGTRAGRGRSGSALNPPITRIADYTVTLFDLVPAAAAVLAALLPWLRGDAGTGTGFDVPVTFLVDTSSGTTPVKAGMLVAVLALLAAAAPLRALRSAAYVLILATLADYAIQLRRLLQHAHAPFGVESVLGLGVYIGIGAGCLGLTRALAPRPR